MNKKYERYINYIVNNIESPYFKNMRDMYGLSPNEYKSVLSKVFNQPVSIMSSNFVYGELERIIYSEYDNGDWEKYDYDEQGNKIYHESSDGYWQKWEYDDRGNLIYNEDSDGYIEDRR